MLVLFLNVGLREVDDVYLFVSITLRERQGELSKRLPTDRLCLCGSFFVLFFLVFAAEHFEYFVDGAFFEVRLVEECLARGVEHALGGDTTYVLKGVDNPCVDFVAEFVKEDIVLVNHLGIAVYVDFVAGKHGGQLDVVAVLADSQRHLFGTQ